QARGGGPGRHGGGGPLDVTEITVPGRGRSVPEGSNFQSFTPSPNYDQDHVVYASGFAAQDCDVRCPVLFRSEDGGASWKRIRSVDFGGGTVMLPPAYPRDSRIFVIGPNALRVSDDDGFSYRPLTPLGGFAAMSPAFSSGDRRILVGAIPGWTYHDDTTAVTPFEMVPESSSKALSFAFSPTYPADGRLLVGGTDSTTGTMGVVSLCRGSDCTVPAALPGATDTPAVMTSQSYPHSGLAFAWQLDRLFRSTDGG